MDNEKFQTIGSVINQNSPIEFKVVLKPFLKLNPNKKIKLLFYSNNKINYLPLKVSKFQPKGTYYCLKLNDSNTFVNFETLKNSKLYSLVANNEFINENWWKDYQIVLENHYYKINQIWNNGHYDLAKISYHGKNHWVPLIGEHLDYINHDRKLIYLNKMGVLDEV